MGRRNSYMFTNKQHTLKGIMSTILGIISLATIIYAVAVSYYRAGDIPLQYGAAVFLVTFFSLTGAVIGVVSKTEKDKFYVFSYVGIILNVIALAFISMILYAGAYA